MSRVPPFLDKSVKKNKETQKIVKKSDTGAVWSAYNKFRIQETAPNGQK